MGSFGAVAITTALLGLFGIVVYDTKKDQGDRYTEDLRLYCTADSGLLIKILHKVTGDHRVNQSTNGLPSF